MANGQFSLTTSSQTLFDARTAAEGGAGDARNLADLLVGRIRACYVKSDSASTSLAIFFVNGETAPRPVVAGDLIPAIRAGKIFLVTAIAVSTATVYFGILAE